MLSRPGPQSSTSCNSQCLDVHYECLWLSASKSELKGQFWSVVNQGARGSGNILSKIAETKTCHSKFPFPFLWRGDFSGLPLTILSNPFWGNFQVSSTFLSNLSSRCLPEFATTGHHWPPQPPLATAGPKLNDNPSRQEETGAWIVINIRFEIVSQYQPDRANFKSKLYMNMWI